MYHLASKSMSRLDSSAAAVLSYRVGYKLRDPHDDLMKYPHRDISEIRDHFLINWECPGKSEGARKTYQAILNEVGRTETRCNSRLWREFEIALPYEGSDSNRATLVEGFALRLARKYGITLVVAIHMPPNRKTQNHHAHLLASTRFVIRDESGQVRLGAKNRDLDSREMLELVRKLWEDCLNEYYQNYSIDKTVSCKSLEKQNIGRIPTIHEGPFSKNDSRKERERCKINEAILKLNLVASPKSISPAEVLGLIPNIVEELQRKLSKATVELGRLYQELRDELAVTKLTQRQTSQVAALKQYIAEAITTEDSTFAVSEKLRLTVRRGGIAGGPFDRLRSKLPSAGGDSEVQNAREGIDIMASLFDSPCDETLDKLKKWIKRNGEGQLCKPPNLDDPQELQRLLRWLRDVDTPEAPEPPNTPLI